MLAFFFSLLYNRLVMVYLRRKVSFGQWIGVVLGAAAVGLLSI